MAQKFCNCIEVVENYQEAKKDNFKKWQMHHRLETHNSEGELRLIQLSREELKALDMYYNRPAEELIWLRLKEHTRIHSKGRKVSEAQKRKVSETLKGHKVSEETRLKIAQKLKGIRISEETKLKISKTLKGGNKTSFKKGHKFTAEQERKRIETSRKNMAIKVEIFNKHYKNIMTWNDFQTYYSKHKRDLL
jgi:hypothetical protein